MSTSPHIIRSVCFDVNVPDDNAATVATRIIRKTDINAALSAALLKFDSRTDWILVDRLEIDLGNIGEESGYDLADRISEEIAAQLERSTGMCQLKTHHIHPASTSEGREIVRASQATIQEREIELYLYYLKNGTLPWYANGAVDFHHTVAEALKGDPEIIGGKLKSSLTTNTAVERFFATAGKKNSRLLLSVLHSKDVVRNIIQISRLGHLLSDTERIEFLNRLYITSLSTLQMGQVEIWSFVFSQLQSFFRDLPARKAVLLPGIVRYFSSNLEPALSGFIDGIKHRDRESFYQSAPEIFDQSLSKAATNCVTDPVDRDPISLSTKNQENHDDAGIYVSDAGIVLLNAALMAHFFAQLGWTYERKFVSERHRSRAIAWLHYVVYGQMKIYEYNLSIFKILCGIEPHEISDIRVGLSRTEKEMAGQFLSLVVEQWSALKTTTVRNLQSAFLQRRGKLKLEAAGWNLYVESKPYDILIERLPWSFTIIKFSWMSKPIYTQWLTRI